MGTRTKPPCCSLSAPCCWLGVLLGLLSVSSLYADEFLLNSGARISGRWLNRGERPLTSYVIQTDQGARLTLARSQVVRAVRQAPAEEEYQRLAPTYPDTSAAQWELAEWCREHRLPEQREQHLRRVVELDPRHVRAWYGLGYSQLRGEWVRQDEVLAEQGYELFKGRWRLPQEIELLKEGERIEEAQRRWLIDLRRWRSQLSSETAREALVKIQAVRDPHAVPALARLLRRDSHRGARLLYVDVLGRIDSGSATRLLVGTALDEDDEEVFHACVDQLVHRKTPTLIKLFAESLKDASNRRVNRAGYTLGRLADKVAIEPLIDALVTVHLITLPDPTGRSAGTVTTGVIRRNGEEIGSPLVINSGPRTIEARLPNRGVLEGLERLAGLSFGYDQTAWRHWYARYRDQQQAPSLGRRALP